MKDPNSGEGWYELRLMPSNTTHIVYIYESGWGYAPAQDVTEVDFLLASAEGNAHRLMRVDDLAPRDAEVAAFERESCAIEATRVTAADLLGALNDNTAEIRADLQRRIAARIRARTPKAPGQ